MPSQAQRHRDGTSGGGKRVGWTASLDDNLPLREAGDTRATGHAGLVQAAGRLLLGLRAHEDEYVQLRDVRRVLVAVRAGGLREFFHSSQHACALQPGLVRSLQVLLQQSALLRGGPSLSQRLRQALPLLLLQDHGELLEEAARR